jgi:hypothetical protein
MRSHIWVKARILQVSSTKRMPAFTKKLIDATTLAMRSSGTWPDSLHRVEHVDGRGQRVGDLLTGVAPASCRW